MSLRQIREGGIKLKMNEAASHCNKEFGLHVTIEIMFRTRIIRCARSVS